MTGQDIGASVRARLLNKAKVERQDFNLILTRYALERLLYRLGASRYAERFLLKSALLFDLWFDIPHRPTRDADLLGFGPAEMPIIEGVFRDLCAGASEPDDGIRFQPGTVRAEEIRKDANYAGIRVTLVSLGIANSRMKDFFDLWVLARQTAFDGATLDRAIRATFDWRATPLPDGVPFGQFCGIC